MLNGVTAVLVVLGLALNGRAAAQSAVCPAVHLVLDIRHRWWCAHVRFTPVPSVAPALPPALIGAAAVLDWVVEMWTGLLDGRRQSCLPWRSLSQSFRARTTRTPISGHAKGLPLGRYHRPGTVQCLAWPQLSSPRGPCASSIAFHGTTRFLAPDVGATDLLNPTSATPQASGKSLAVLLNPALNALSFQPTGECLRRRATLGGSSTAGSLFMSFVVLPHRRQIRGLSGAGSAGRVSSSSVSTAAWANLSPRSSRFVISEPSRFVPDGQAPFLGQWRGNLSVPRDGSYTLEAAGPMETSSYRSTAKMGTVAVTQSQRIGHDRLGRRWI